MLFTRAAITRRVFPHASEICQAGETSKFLFEDVHVVGKFPLSDASAYLLCYSFECSRDAKDEKKLYTLNESTVVCHPPRVTQQNAPLVAKALVDRLLSTWPQEQLDELEARLNAAVIKSHDFHLFQWLHDNKVTPFIYHPHFVDIMTYFLAPNLMDCFSFDMLKVIPLKERIAMSESFSALLFLPDVEDMTSYRSRNGIFLSLQFVFRSACRGNTEKFKRWMEKRKLGETEAIKWEAIVTFDLLQQEMRHSGSTVIWMADTYLPRITMKTKNLADLTPIYEKILQDVLGVKVSCMEGEFNKRTCKWLIDHGQLIPFAKHGVVAMANYVHNAKKVVRLMEDFKSGKHDNNNYDEKSKSPPHHLIPEQVTALRSIQRNPLTFLTGKGGTGKTFLCSLLPGKVMFLGPTNDWKDMIRSDIGPHAYTAHYFIFHHAEMAIVTQCQFIVYDELSMLDEWIFGLSMCILLDYYQQNKLACHTIVLMGDANQLESVAPGAVIQDVKQAVPICQLRVNHRVTKESVVIDRVLDQLMGSNCPVYALDEFIGQPITAPLSLQVWDKVASCKEIVQLYRSCSAPTKVQVICFTNKCRKEINDELSYLLGYLPRGTYHAGQRLVMRHPMPYGVFDPVRQRMFAISVNQRFVVKAAWICDSRGSVGYRYGSTGQAVQKKKPHQFIMLALQDIQAINKRKQYEPAWIPPGALSFGGDQPVSIKADAKKRPLDLESLLPYRVFKKAKLTSVLGDVQPPDELQPPATPASDPENKAPADGVYFLKLQFIQRHMEASEAVTAHAMEGKQSDVIVYVLEANKGCNKKLVYTAFSRARERLRIYVKFGDARLLTPPTARDLTNPVMLAFKKAAPVRTTALGMVMTSS